MMHIRTIEVWPKNRKIVHCINSKNISTEEEMLAAFDYKFYMISDSLTLIFTLVLFVIEVFELSLSLYSQWK